MPVSPYHFFRIGKKYHEVLEEMHGETSSISRFRRLIDRHGPDETDPEFAREQLEEHNFLQIVEGKERAYRLAPHVENVLGTLLKKRRESVASELRGILEALQTYKDKLSDAFERHDTSKTRRTLRDIEGVIADVRGHTRDNLESIKTRVETLTEERREMSTQERFERVNELWTDIIEPLETLIEVDAPFEQHLDQLETLLREGNERFPGNNRLRRRFESVRVQLTSMRQELLASHRDARGEVKPLYEQLRKESELTRGAAAALKTVRHEGAEALNVESKVAPSGWKKRNLLADEKLRSYIATVADYEPSEDVVLAESPDRQEVPLLRRDTLEEALEGRAPVSDVLAYLFDRWPDKPLDVLLRAYGWIYRGEFGPVVRLEEASRRSYVHDEAAVEARPIALERLER